MEKMNAHERMLALCKYKGMNRAEFERFAKMPKSSISHIYNHIAPNTLQRVMACMPEVNPLWLLLGQGEMLRTEEQMAERRKVERVGELEKRVAALEQELSSTRAGHAEALSAAKAENEALARRVQELQSLMEIQKAKTEAYYDIIRAMRLGSPEKPE